MPQKSVATPRRRQAFTQLRVLGKGTRNKRVATQLGISLAEVGREALTLPKRYDLSCLNKSYRKRGETRLQKGLSAEFTSAV